MNEKGLQLKYFVLKPRGNTLHAEASRQAMRRYAIVISKEDSKLAQGMIEWVQRETV